MDLSSFLQDLHLSSTEKPLPSARRPPITELLAVLRERLIGAAAAESCALIGRVERFFHTADPHWLFWPPSANQGAEQQQEAGSLGAWAELQEAYVALVVALTHCAALPLCDDDSGSLPAADYQTVPTRVIAVSSALKALLATLGECERGGGANRAQRHGLLLAVTPQICVFAVTHDQVQAWTNQDSRQAAQSLQGALLRAGHWRDSAHLLIGDERQEEDGGREKVQGILGGILDVLQPHLTKDTWWRCEAVKLVFAWTLLQVTRPSLSCHLPRLLPPALLLNDHHRQENCMLGIRCLHHIVVNSVLMMKTRCMQLKLDCGLDYQLSVSGLLTLTICRTSTHGIRDDVDGLGRLMSTADGPPLSLVCFRFLPKTSREFFLPTVAMVLLRGRAAAELRQMNRALVVHEALFKHLYTTDAAVIQLALSCLLDLLLVLEEPPFSLSPSSCRRRPCRHDDVLRLILTHMEVEHKVALRRVYAAALPQYVDRMGVAVCRHLKRVERVVLRYLEVADPPEEQSRLNVLEALHKTLISAWPRMKTDSRVAELLRCLLRLLVDVCSDARLHASVRQQLSRQTLCCVKLLDAVCGGTLQPLLLQVDSSCAGSEVVSCLATITMTTDR